MNELIVKEEEQLKGIEASKAEQIKATFDPMYKMLTAFEEEFKTVSDMEISPAACAKAKDLRLRISKIRISADKERKSLKEEYLGAVMPYRVFIIFLSSR